jgi:DNA-directed RNA polymerase subunit RPC12/RpoP
MSLGASHHCGVCRSYMDDEDLFCANCGTENPTADAGALRLAHAASHFSFDCTACGASMSYDASAQALRCPFCGSTRMEKREGGRVIQPDAVVPLTISRKQAERILREWLGRGFWRPADAAHTSHIGDIASVYVPYWVFEADAFTMWTADSSPAPAGSRGDWYPLSGENRSRYTDVLVGGSSILTPSETASIAPFDLSTAVTPNRIDLDNAIVETFRVPRKMARPLARGTVESLEMSACQRYVPNRCRNLKVNVRIEGLRGRPILLPVWILAYRYREQVFRVLINAQNGKIAGAAPFSYNKLGAVIAIGCAAIALIVLATFLLAILS